MKGIILGGRYELLEKIGEGGMSEVYKAKCNKLNRFVAIKILKKQFANNIEIAKKFKREATAIANLSDANIVNILDVGTQDDMDYIVMEYVNGRTLKELINYKGKLSYTTAINIAIQIAKALDCAHRNNIVHRDIKPQNILVTEAGKVKVTDFGIAKSTDSHTITNTTSIIGSAHYLSPEQAKGTYIDFRSDIYSFGIVLYEMVTGRLPFEGDSPVTVALKHLQEEPVPPKNINSAIPDSLNKVILKAIQKVPVKRYQNVKEIIQDLQKIQENPDVIIGLVSNTDNDSTIIMSPIQSNNTSTKINNNYKEDDYEEYEDEDYEDEKKSKKIKSGLKKALIGVGSLIIILILGSVGFFLAMRNNTSNEVEVPNIVGKLVEEAKSEVEELGLVIQVKSTEYSDEAENTILKISPSVGTKVKKDSIIFVTVSVGEELIKMPNLKDYEKTNIESVLKSYGFTNYEIKEEYSDDVEKGRLIKQSPEAETEVSKNTEIQIIVSKGQETKMVDIPDVVGKSLKEAKTILEEAKLKVNDEIKYNITHNKDEDGIVLEQNVSGTKIQEGAAIKLTVGKYEEETIDVASEVGIKNGMTVKEARAKINAKELKLVFSDGSSSDDDAIITDFTKEVTKGGTVTLTTEKPKQQEQEQEQEEKPVAEENNN